MIYEVHSKKVQGKKVYLEPCPHQCFYESVNMFVVKKVGDIYCKECKYYKGMHKEDDKINILCIHPEGKETIPIRKYDKHK